MNSTPLYIQLRNRISYLIISKKLKEGDRLPTVRELATNLGINYNTVNRAYMDLEKDGYIVSRRRLGTFVASPLQEISQQDDVTGAVNSLVADLIAQCDDLGVPRVILLEIMKAHIENDQ